jgi:hypothetical protein
MKISKRIGTLGLYAFMPSFGFFCFSMFTWGGHNLITRDSTNPVIAGMQEEQFKASLWVNDLLLGLTITAFLIAVTSVALYVLADE